MMRQLSYILIFSIFIVLLQSCDDDDQLIGVDEELEAYFDRFIEEGALRGHVIDFDSILVAAHITIIDPENIAGTCSRFENKNNEIKIDNFFWERSDDLNREFVVFHELGHCYLSREHTEEENIDGTCSSIMASGTGTCNLGYNDDTRETYLNELFDF